MKRKLIAALILFTGLSVFFTLSASAYVDPATTSILIQSLAGVAAVVVTGVVVLWVSLKRKVKKALHIDDSKNTEVEDEFSVVGENGEAAETNAEAAGTEAGAAETEEKKTEPSEEEEIDFDTADE